jgi:hypothetical protein
MHQLLRKNIAFMQGHSDFQCGKTIQTISSTFLTCFNTLTVRSPEATDARNCESTPCNGDIKKHPTEPKFEHFFKQFIGLQST